MITEKERLGSGGEKSSAAKKLIIGDFAPVKFKSVMKWLQKERITSETATDSQAFLTRIHAESFDVCIVNLLLGGTGPFKLVSKVKEASRNKDIKIVVVSKQVQKSNIENVIQAGADDFLAEPFENENVYNRILYHLAPKTVVEEVGYDGDYEQDESRQYVRLLLKAAEILSRTDHGSLHESILHILQKAATLLESNRLSLIIVDKEKSTGTVMASSDDPNFKDFSVNLAKYPEVMHVVNTGTIVLVDDVSQHKLTQQIQESVKTISIGSIMVFPIRFRAEVLGVLVIRRPKARELPNMEVLAVVQALANILAAHSNLKMLLSKIYRDFGRRENDNKAA